MDSRFRDADYQLRWPRSLFVEEAAHLLNDRGRREWHEACELLLEDAFVGGWNSGPLSDFREVEHDPWPSPRTASRSLTAQERFLRDLMKNADKLLEDETQRRPYWSQRKAGTQPQPSDRESTVRRFVILTRDLHDRGYFEKFFDKDCVDNPAEVDPAELIEDRLGVPELWPLDPARLAADPDLFCDVVEVLHDFAARPIERNMHRFDGCGWHHTKFSIPVGRRIYRWRVNQLLERSVLGLRFADEGEDQGRMVTVSADARQQLVEQMVTRDGGEVGDQIRHAIALYRARGADKHAKRSAVVALAHVLEERRGFIRAELLRKDEVALFEIANKFNLRHQDAKQQKDYDPVFLDWIFWWYLATIELSDRLLARREAFDPGDAGPH